MKKVKRARPSTHDSVNKIIMVEKMSFFALVMFNYPLACVIESAPDLLTPWRQVEILNSPHSPARESFLLLL